LLKPFKGKTVLASLIIEECKKKEGFTVFYFYCARSDPLRRTCLSVLKGLLHQALKSQRELVPVCHDKITDNGYQTLNNVESAKGLLDLAFENLPGIFVVIDGLDECDGPDIKMILDFLNKEVSRCDNYSPGKLRVLITSWFMPEIKKRLDEASILEMVDRDNEADIEAYVKNEVTSMNQERRYNLDAQQQRDIIDLTCRGSKGETTPDCPWRSVDSR
jgi:hypothetical protein